MLRATTSKRLRSVRGCCSDANTHRQTNSNPRVAAVAVSDFRFRPISLCPAVAGKAVIGPVRLVRTPRRDTPKRVAVSSAGELRRRGAVIFHRATGYRPTDMHATQVRPGSWSRSHGRNPEVRPNGIPGAARITCITPSSVPARRCFPRDELTQCPNTVRCSRHNRAVCECSREV